MWRLWQAPTGDSLLRQVGSKLISSSADVTPFESPFEMTS